MRKFVYYGFTLLSLLLLFQNCGEDEEESEISFKRYDAAVKLDIPLSGSLQNPAFSPDGDMIVFTLFRNGYNIEPADIYTYNLESKELHLLVKDGSANVNLPGACWNVNNESIIFSSSRDPHDEIYRIDDSGNPGDEIQITSRANYMAYEPSFSPDGAWVVFESHIVDTEDRGVIFKFKLDNSAQYQALTGSNEDCRQPNWSPAGNYILFQKLTNNQWDIWVMKTDGSGQRMVTSGGGDKTDACFTNDGQYIIFSSDADLEYANIYKISVNGGSPVRLTNFNGYDGAPSISADNKKLIFESYNGDPDDSEGTALWLLSL